MRKTLVIVNPAAGKRLGEKKLEAVEACLKRDGSSVERVLTDAPGCAARLAVEADGYDRIVCCGGDGTLHETLQGVMRRENRPELGYIPCGTTNDYASSLKIPRDPLRAAEAIAARGTISHLDVGCFGEQFFSYVAAFGIFTECSYETPQSMKNALGYLAYVLEGSKDLFNLKSVAMKVAWDGGEDEGCYLYGSVSNSMSIAGLIRLKDSQAALDDGLLELVLIRFPQSLDELVKMIAMLRNGRFDGRLIRFEHVTRVDFESPEAVSWTLDGEFGAFVPKASVQIAPRAVTLVH